MTTRLISIRLTTPKIDWMHQSHLEDNGQWDAMLDKLRAAQDAELRELDTLLSEGYSVVSETQVDARGGLSWTLLLHRRELPAPPTLPEALLSEVHGADGLPIRIGDHVLCNSALIADDGKTSIRERHPLVVTALRMLDSQHPCVDVRAQITLSDAEAAAQGVFSREVQCSAVSVLAISQLIPF